MRPPGILATTVTLLPAHRPPQSPHNASHIASASLVSVSFSGCGDFSTLERGKLYRTGKSSAIKRTGARPAVSDDHRGSGPVLPGGDQAAVDAEVGPGDVGRLVTG